MAEQEIKRPGSFLGYSLPVDQRRELLESLFVFGKDNQQAFLSRMMILLVISTIIACSGLLANSAAVVIGAMLVAPMMRPVMSCAAAITLNWPSRFNQSLILVFVMAFFAVALSSGLTLFAPDMIQLPSEVIARTKPTIFDLVIALASGAAGAYTMTRKEATAIPGVAMAVALLPPLASCGILITLEAYDLALKAFVLFLTNFASMILAGAITFRLVGVQPQSQKAKRLFSRSFLFIFTLLVVLITIPLYFYSHEVWYTDMYLAQRSDELQKWLSDNQAEIADVLIDRENQVLYLKIQGPNPPVNINQLYTEIKRVRTEQTGRTDPFSIDIQWTKSHHYSWPIEDIKRKQTRQLKQDYYQEIQSYQWHWVGTQYADGNWLKPGNGDQYTLNFSKKDFQINMPCGEINGQYDLQQEVISLKANISEACKGQKVADRFTNDLNTARMLKLDDDHLALTLRDNNGVIYFDGVQP